MLDFYDAGLVQQLATNLFYGWGYNFYKAENQLRADDQLVRAKCVFLLNETAASVGAAEAAFRREHLPPPTRAKPYPDADAVAGAQKLERLHAELVALAARIQNLPAPESDLVFKRYREEATTLLLLLDRDAQLVGRCDLLRSTLAGKDAVWLLGNLSEFLPGIGAVEAALRSREQFLLGFPSLQV